MSREQDMIRQVSDIAVVTVRSKETTQNATYELLQILGEITTVTLLTTALKQDSPIFDEYEVIEISSEGTGRSLFATMLKFIINQFRMTRAIMRREEEIVLFFGATAYIVPILFARLLGKVVILEPRGDVPLTLRLRWQEDHSWPIAAIAASLARILEHVGYVSATGIITYTESMAAELGLDRYDHKLQTDGARHVPIDEFTVRTPIEERERRIGYVGRLDVEKGTDTLATVIEQLPRDVAFTFVGDGPHRDGLQHRLAEYVSRDQVEFTGWVDHDEVATHLNRFKLIVMPSEPTEGLPSTILEAFACGTPVYATPVSGIPDVIRDNETGLIMENTDPGTVAERIVEVLDGKNLNDMSDRCRTTAESIYCLDATVKRYETMLAAIVAKNA